MADDYYRLDERVRAIETREAGRDVKVELNTAALNRLSALVGTAGVGLFGLIVTFVLTGGQ